MLPSTSRSCRAYVAWRGVGVAVIAVAILILIALGLIF